MKTYSDYLNRFFPGRKIQKISVDAGFSCPNRDGTISYGGCTYCRNDSFTPTYCNSRDSIKLQLQKGKDFFSRKYPEMKYLAYFQSYTGTHGKDPESLKKIYLEAMETEDIVGIVVATRPDSIPLETVRILADLNRDKPVFIEIGAETSHDETLRIINRNHSWEDVVETTGRLAAHNLHCGIHLIAGLPGESEEMILETVSKTLLLPIETIKLHQLQILFGTEMHRQWEKGLCHPTIYEIDQYKNLCRKIIQLVPDHIVIERFLSQSPPELVAAPKWGIKNYQFMNMLKTH